MLSKILGDRTVMTGSVSKGRDKSKSLQMTGRPLMTADELKIMPKDTFIVTRTGVKPMKTMFRLFLMPQAAVRKVEYADKKFIEERIQQRYGKSKLPHLAPKAEKNRFKEALTNLKRGQENV